MKRIISIFLSLVVGVTMLFTVVSAVNIDFMRTSEYFDGMEVWAESYGNGSIRIYADI